MTAIAYRKKHSGGERKYNVWAVNQDAEYHEAGAAGRANRGCGDSRPSGTACANLSNRRSRKKLLIYEQRSEAAQRIPRFAPCHIPERDLLLRLLRGGHSLGVARRLPPWSHCFISPALLEIASLDQVRRWRFHGGVFFLKRNTAVSRFLLSGPAAVVLRSGGGACDLRKLPIVSGLRCLLSE